MQRLLLKVQQYDLAVIYTPGKQLAVADALSHTPDHEADAGEAAQIKGLDDVVEAYVDMIIRTMLTFDGRLAEICQATLADHELTRLKQVIVDSWPREHQQCLRGVWPSWNVRDELSVADEVVFKGTRIMIPRAGHKDKLRKIHEGHMGIEKCRWRARDVVY